MKRLVWDTTRPGKARIIGSIIAALLGLLIPVTMAAETVPWVAWPGFIWLAVVFYLFLVLVVLELPMMAVKLWLRRAAQRTAAPTDGVADQAPAELATARQAPSPEISRTEDEPTTSAETVSDRPDAPNPDRRLFLARGAAIFAGLTTAGFVGYGMRTAMGPPRLDRVQIPVARLPRSLDGMRLAVVSDIHLGPIARAAHSQRIVDVINSIDADIVAIVGDLVDDTVEELGAAAAPLRGIQARQGAYFVTGNHEYYSGYESWIDEVESLGIRPLRNERVGCARPRRCE